jgi:hypothetical protein
MTTCFGHIRPSSGACLAKTVPLHVKINRVWARCWLLIKIYLNQNLDLETKFLKCYSALHSPALHWNIFIWEYICWCWILLRCILFLYMSTYCYHMHVTYVSVTCTSFHAVGLVTLLLCLCVCRYYDFRTTRRYDPEDSKHSSQSPLSEAQISLLKPSPPFSAIKQRNPSMSDTVTWFHLIHALREEKMSSLNRKTSCTVVV